MFFIADMLFRRSNARARRMEEDAPAPRERGKSGRSPRARLREDAFSLLG